MRREPAREVVDDAGEEARLRDAEQEAHGVERGRPLHERHRRGQHTPGEHDPRDPDPCTETFEQDIARHFERDIAEEEDPGADAEHGGGQSEVGIHREGGEADVHAIQEREEIQRAEEGNQSPRHLAQR